MTLNPVTAGDYFFNGMIAGICLVCLILLCTYPLFFRSNKK